ncbi:hypothetical protein QYE76_055823, partial [Lolium multiflorum]
TDLLEIIHTDVCGPMSVASRGGYRYVLTFTDDLSRYGYIYFMKHKSETFEKFKEFQSEVENQRNKKIKFLRSDRGGEYLSYEFGMHLKKCGILSQLTPPGTPQRNGVSERRNRTLLDMVRSMMSLTDLPLSFWGYALETAAFTLNRAPSKSVATTPYELWFNKKPKLSFLKVWGCEAYVKKLQPDKLEPKAEKCVFIGYPKETIGYTFYHRSEGKIFVAKNGTFLEKEFLTKEVTGRKVELDEVTEPSLVDQSSAVPEDVPVPPAPVTEEANDNDHETSSEVATEPRRSTRERTTPDWYDPCLNLMIVDNNDEDPATYEEAMMSPDSNKWQEAMKSEMGSMYDNKVWTLVDLPDSRKAVENKWIFKRKTDADGNITVYKARLVAKGFRQIQGVDYDETFSPVAKLKSVRILLAIAAFFDYEIWQMDVKTAFLNGDIEEELYMVQPKGFVDPKNANMVCKLQRSIYGLKQASRSWNRRFDKDLGEAAYILGIKIYRDRSRRLIGLSQSTYLDKILKKFRMDESKKGFLPMLPGKVLSKTQGPATAEERERMNQIPYASAVGSIMYAMLCTRPDIAHAVSLTSRYQSDPGMEHWTAVKNILKYLKRTKDMFLCYGGDQELVVTSYTDASWNTDPDDSKSQSGYVFILNGAAVSWCSSKQCTVAKSSTESEYIAASEASSEAVWMKSLEAELQKRFEHHDPCEMIRELKVIFETHAAVESYEASKQFFGCMMEEGSSVSEHVFAMSGHARKLSDLGIVIPNQLGIHRVLQSLPPSYKNFVMNYNMQNMNKELPELFSMLKSAEVEIQKEHQVLMVNKTTKFKKQGKPKKDLKKGGKKAAAHPEKPKGGPKPDTDCYYCNGKGHWKRNCSKYLADLKSGLVKKKKGISDIHVIDVYLTGSRTSELRNKRSLARDEVTMRVGNGSKVDVIAVGTLPLHLPSGLVLDLNNCYLVPALSMNIISGSCLMQDGYSFKSENNGCSIFMNNIFYGHAPEKNGLFLLNLDSSDTHVHNIDAKRIKLNDNSTYMWHCRLGHIGVKRMKKLHSDGLLESLDFQSLDRCEACLMGKMTKTPFSGIMERATDLLEIIHTDVCGPMSVASRGGYRYVLTFTDDLSRYGYIYFMKHKSETFEKFKEFQSEVENQRNKKIKFLRSDRGGEYLSYEFGMHLKKCGILSQLTPPGTPQRNGVSERRNRTLLDMVRSMMSLTDLPLSFWGYALETAAFTLNRAPSKSVATTPYELWFNKKPKLSFLKVWGCEAYVKKLQPDKLEPKAEKCVFIGYPKETIGYTFYHRSEGKIFVAKNGTFLEKEFLTKEVTGRKVELDEVTEPSLVDQSSAVPEDVPVPPAPVTEEANDNDHETSSEVATEPRRSTRERTTPDWYDPCLNLMIVDNNDEDPATYEEAMMSPDSNKWQEAMKSEMGSMYDNKVWTLVDLPDSRKAVENKWIFKRKTDADGNVTVYKARLVAKGFRQIQGVDYDETFSPVAKLKSVRILLAIAAFFDYEIWQMDVKTAFLNGDIEEELYMVQPKGFVDPKNANMVCKLQRSIYGLKQASRSWNRRFDKVIKDFGFIQCHGEACIYKKVSGSSVAFLILYVDDILLIGNDIELLSSVKGYLNKCFSMKDLGEAAYILGIKIYRDRSRRLIGLSQSTYLDKILKKFRMDESKKGFLPMLPGKVLSKTQGPATAEERERMNQIPYASAVGSIIYQSDPGMEHWTAVKNILKYLKRTKDMFLCYGGDQELVVTSYTDASWNTDPDDSKSQSGYVFILNGAAVSWCSSKQCTKAAAHPEKPKGGPKPDTDCYYCNGKGHWKRNCSKYLADLKSGLVKKKKETAAFTLNRAPSKSVATTPYELWFNKKPKLSFLKVWGCEAYVKKLQPDKLEPKAEKCSSAVPEDVPVPPAPVTEEANDNDHETSSEVATEPRRSTRERTTPDWYDPCLNLMIVDNNDEDPATYEEAMMSPDSNKWQEAMKSEMGSMYDNKVWTLVDLPDSRKAVENKWIFKRKTDADGNITVYKARLVAKGFRQIQGVDYDETFSPVAKLKSVRILLAIAAFFDYEIWQMDVKTAFLNGDIEEELYMVQPKGFVDPKNADMVCKLQRSIYGLKQASRSWNRRFDKVIKDFGFIQCHGEACIYKKVSGSSVAFLILYVDDILLIGNDIELLSSVKGYLNKCFSMKDLGEAAYILGIKIYRDRSRRLIGLSQSTYLDKILKKFRMDESKKGFLPMLPGKVLSKTQGPATAEERERMNQIPYASAVGSIMYAMLCTRPDIAHAVSLTSRYQSDPGMEHWTAVKNILKYLKRTKDMFLCYGGDQELVVTSYTDASWNTDPDDSKSQSGYVFILNGAAVSWCSSKQCTVAKSSTESEYIAASEASSEAVWMKRFIVELGVVPSALDPLVIYCDNMGAIANAQEPRSHKKLKHIKLRFHSIREYIEDGEVKICKVHTDLNVADPLTKALPRAKHDQHQNAMGVRYLTM